MDGHEQAALADLALTMPGIHLSLDHVGLHPRQGVLFQLFAQLLGVVSLWCGFVVGVFLPHECNREYSPLPKGQPVHRNPFVAFPGRNATAKIQIYPCIAQNQGKLGLNLAGVLFLGALQRAD